MTKFTKYFLTVLAFLTLLISGAVHPQTVHAQNGIVLQITQVDTSEFPMVRVYISVRDANGEPLAINPDILVLKENGVAVDAQNIQGTETVDELTSLLVMDVSGSMNFAGKLDAAKKAAKDYVGQLRSQDQAGIVTFNTKVNVVSDVTLNHSTLLKAIDKIQAKDDTAMYDALAKAVEMLNPLPGRKAIIVMTDGMDNASQSTPEEVLSGIGYSGLSISTIGLGIIPEGETEPDVYKGLDQEILTMLAEKAGGRYGFVEDEQALADLYDQMRRALQSEIVITYTTPQTLRDGVSRSLTVELSGDTSGISTSGQTKFNPGGLVPEVAKPASWLVFAAVLGVLFVLLLIPFIISLVNGMGEKTKKKKKPRIKLLD